MKTEKSRTILSKKDKSYVGLEEAISEAKRRVETLEAEAAQLRISVRTFEDNEKGGVPFPGS
ncbi:MAG: hypothetical protein WB763_14220 [Terriglobia bacterium]|jgi:exonuclease VII small subunit